MNNYIIDTEHTVYVDSYENGEEEQVNFYIQKAEIKAENAKEAIKLYFEKELCFSFDIKDAYITHEEEEEGSEAPKNTLHYSILVDIDNMEATKEELEAWKKNEIKLYSNNIYLTIHELKPATI